MVLGSCPFRYLWRCLWTIAAFLASSSESWSSNHFRGRVCFFVFEAFLVMLRFEWSDNLESKLSYLLLILFKTSGDLYLLFTLKLRFNPFAKKLFEALLNSSKFECRAFLIICLILTLLSEILLFLFLIILNYLSYCLKSWLLTAWVFSLDS